VAIKEKLEGWALLLGGIALLFNPVFPIHLDRSIWKVLDRRCTSFKCKCVQASGEDTIDEGNLGHYWGGILLDKLESAIKLCQSLPPIPAPVLNSSFPASDR
jgi:hypothetical protein